MLHDSLLSWTRKAINTRFWDGKFFLSAQNQHVYNSEDNRPEFIPFIVPRLGLEYDFSGFWEYPARMGWHVHRSDRRCHAGCPPGVCSAKPGLPHTYGLKTPGISRPGDDEASTPAAKVAFMQSWLFFGALAEAHAICNLSIGPADYSSDVFNTSRLNSLPLRLFQATQNSGHAGSQELKDKLYAIIRQVQLMITRASDWEDEYEYTETQCEVLFSIHIILRILSLALLCHSRKPILTSEDRLKVLIADTVTDWKPEGQMTMMTFSYDRLSRSGWCKSEMWHVLQTFDVATAAFYLQRPHALQHHDKCTDTTCMAYQTDENDYSTVHINRSCDCAFVFVEPTQLRDILARNVIPVVVVTDDLQVSVVEGTNYPYIAFSHVCVCFSPVLRVLYLLLLSLGADGLGNPFHNALPCCQIRLLRDLARELCKKFDLGSGKTSIAFWIDTLCIPVAPELKEYRKLAIRLLARIYSNATGVLVLDRELRHFESSKASILEFCIRLMCSGWLKRLWTLQEASLASAPGEVGTLYVQMADGPAHWNCLARRFEYKPSRDRRLPRKPSPLALSVQEAKIDTIYGMHLLTAMEDRLPSAHTIQNPRFASRFQKIVSAVQNRSTSKREDEAVCMASLVGLDLSPILDAKEADERMARFYQQLHEIPTAIIFADFGVPNFLSNNLTVSPFRWAPKSLLLLERPMEISLADGAMRFAEPTLPLYGSCENDGFHIRHPGFIFTDPDMIIKRETMLIDSNSGELYSLSLALSKSSPGTIGPVERCALIFKSDTNLDAVIVAIEIDTVTEDGMLFFVTIVGHGVVKPRGKQHSEENVVEPEHLRGVFSKRDQSWCIT